MKTEKREQGPDEDEHEPDYQSPYGDGEVDCEGEFETCRDELNDGICLK